MLSDLEGSSDSDEELDEDESDGSNTEALFEYIDVQFRSVIDRKIEEAEKFFDQHDYALTIQSMIVTPTSLPLDNDIDHLQLPHNHHDDKTPPNTSSVVDPPKIATTNNVETQTDDSSFIQIVGLDSMSKPDPETARGEISQLRMARESLVNKRKELADKIKQVDGVDANDEKKLYRYEEAIEAIDSAIDFKNEIICGQECILSNNLAPGENETNLISRLTQLTLLDLQRLLCIYFTKVVELRYSTKRLEKGIEELENGSEKMSRRLVREQSHMREIQSEYESRIKLLIGLYNKDPSSALDTYLRGLEKSCTATKQRNYDLERSLTELLVRHGYLLNGADYDVKQVVRMLGIDTVQMGLNWREDGKPKSGEIPAKVRSALESAASEGQGMSRRMREAFAQRRPLDSQMPSYSGAHHVPHPSTSRHHHHHQYHHYNPNHSHHREPEPPEIIQPQVPEVRREKRKLIIQSGQQT